MLNRLFEKADAGRWGLTREEFAEAIDVSVERMFSSEGTSARELDRYLASLHVADLALAWACAIGREAAWEHFVLEHRPVLYRAADAIDSTGGARELADSLYGDLYGLHAAGAGRRSLFRYFHGRSSLATWLRAVLAQRYVDSVRSRRRVEPLPDDDFAVAPVGDPQVDVDRPMLVRLILRALRAAISQLSPKDRLRLRSYYAAGLTLAQIGRITGEHEATVSRRLSKSRRDLRDAVVRHLRDEAHLNQAQIDRAMELAVEDPGILSLDRVFELRSDRKESTAERSE